MRFSILLPTRNGGNFLDNCIRSILEQDYDDFELVISDNANEDGTDAIIKQFSTDTRLKVVRNDVPVSVTDNWNNAYRASCGDYILMMGDDDYLLPGYFVHMEKILDKYGQPDCVVHNAYSYVAPSSIDDNVESFYAEQHFNFGDNLTTERSLEASEQFDMVRDMFRFKVRIPLNMQTTLIKRRAADSVRGGVFQPPFPDHYALNSLLLTSRKWVFSPEKVLVVGVSPKSFGHYVYSNQQGKGLAYLGIAADFPGRLPGNELMNGMHVWLNLLQRNYSELLQGIEVDRAGYVRRQVYAWHMQQRLGNLGLVEFLKRFGMLSWADWGGLLASAVDVVSWKRLFWHLSASGKSSAEAQWHGLRPLEGVGNIREFADWVTRRDGTEKRATS